MAKPIAKHFGKNSAPPLLVLLDVSPRPAPRSPVRSDRAVRGLALTALCAVIHLVADGGALLLCAPEWSPSALADYHRAHKLSRLTSMELI